MNESQPKSLVKKGRVSRIENGECVRFGRNVMPKNRYNPLTLFYLLKVMDINSFPKLYHMTSVPSDYWNKSFFIGRGLQQQSAALC